MTQDNCDKSKIKKCFIITPIGGNGTEIRRHIDGVVDAVIGPVLEQYGYEVKVAHRMSKPGSINKQIIKEIYESDLAISNLTELNPNVMYELAFRHSTGKPVIIMAEEGTNLPFDVIGERTIFYTNDIQGTIDLKDQLEVFIKELSSENNEKIDISNPIYDALGNINIMNKLMEEVESAQGDKNVNVMEYVLNKLETIEMKIGGMQDSTKASSYRAKRVYNGVRKEYRAIVKNKSETFNLKKFENSLNNDLDTLGSTIKIRDVKIGGISKEGQFEISIIFESNIINTERVTNVFDEIVKASLGTNVELIKSDFILTVYPE